MREKGVDIFPPKLSWKRGVMAVLMALCIALLSVAQFHHHSEEGNVCVCGMLHVGSSHALHHDSESAPCDTSGCHHHNYTDVCGHLIFDKCDVPHPQNVPSLATDIFDDLPVSGTYESTLLSVAHPDTPYKCDIGEDDFSISDGYRPHAPGRSPPLNPAFQHILSTCSR